MGYLFLAISIFAGLTKGFCGKKISGLVESYKDAMLTNFVRMVLCVVIGYGFVVFSGGSSQLCVNSKTLLITLFSGISTSLFVILWIISVKKGAYMMIEVFLMMGVIFTAFLCKVFFSENIRINQYIGFGLLVVASYLMCSYNISLKGVFNFKSLCIMIACAIGTSLSDFSQKLFVEAVPNGNTSVFNFYTYVFSSITLFVSYLFCKAKDKGSFSADVGFVKSIFKTVVVMAVCLFISSFFKVLAARNLAAAVLYPLSQGSALILSAVMAALFFKEKQNSKSVAGMICGFVGLIIINLL